MIELLRWQVRLALVAYRERVTFRESILTYRYQTYGWPWRWLRDFVDRVSPFDAFWGYRRRPLRSLLWKASHPLVTMRLASLRWSLKILNASAPYIGPGKFGGNDAASALKAEWLLDHDEWADDVTGDAIDWDRHVTLFGSIKVPWAREMEHWLMMLDAQGFVYVGQYDTERSAAAAFEEDRAEYEQTMEPFEEDVR